MADGNAEELGMARRGKDPTVLLIVSAAIAIVGVTLVLAVDTSYIGIALVGVACVVYGAISRLRRGGRSALAS
jgi:hypothetical protein